MRKNPLTVDEIEKLRLEKWNCKENKDFQFQDRLEIYGSFMDDGDFEYWQPCCYENDEEKRIEAMSLKPDQSLDPQSFEYRRQKKRIFWIQSRFVSYQSHEWKKLINKYDSIILTNDKYPPAWWKNKTKFFP